MKHFILVAIILFFCINCGDQPSQEGGSVTGGGVSTSKTENIAVRCQNGAAQVEYPGVDDIGIHQVHVVGDGGSCAPPQEDQDIATHIVGRVVQVYCGTFSVVVFQRDV